MEKFDQLYVSYPGAVGTTKSLGNGPTNHDYKKARIACIVASTILVADRVLT